MKFEILNDGVGNLKYKGYQFVREADRIYDEDLYKSLVAYSGYNFADSKFDDFYDGFEPICKGEDGRTYSVLFIYDENEKKPFIWQEVEKI